MSLPKAYSLSVNDRIYKLSYLNKLDDLKSYLGTMDYNYMARGNITKRCVMAGTEDVSMYMIAKRTWNKNQKRDFFEHFIERGYLVALDYVLDTLKYDISKDYFNLYLNGLKTRYTFLKIFLPWHASCILESLDHLHKRDYISSVDLLLDPDGSELIKDLLIGVNVET